MFSFKDIIMKSNRPLVMGILNITPDSFYDGGANNAFSQAADSLALLQEQGADIIDIGGCSTAPGRREVSVSEELDRLSFLPELVKMSQVPVSVDTKRVEIAEFALENGVSIINDESGFFSDDMAALIKKYNAGWIFMHTGGGSSDDTVSYPFGVVEHIKEFFCSMKQKAVSYGLKEEQLCYDCGIGFGKTRADDLAILGTSELQEYAPLLVGCSRKRVIGEATGRDNPGDRLFGSIAAASICAYNGFGIFRVHDVAPTVDALNMTEAIRNVKVVR